MTNNFLLSVLITTIFSIPAYASNTVFHSCPEVNKIFLSWQNNRIAPTVGERSFDLFSQDPGDPIHEFPFINVIEFNQTEKIFAVTTDNTHEIYSVTALSEISQSPNPGLSIYTCEYISRRFPNEQANGITVKHLFKAALHGRCVPINENFVKIGFECTPIAQDPVGDV